MRIRHFRPAARQTEPATGTALVVMRQMRCRWCAQTIRSSSRHCPICMRPLEREEIGVFDWPPWRDKDARAIATDLSIPLAFDYTGGTDRTRRHIIAEHAFEWAQALYVRGHEARRGETRSFRLDHMENVIDERSGAPLDGVEAIRRALLQSDRPAAPAPSAPSWDSPAEPAAARTRPATRHRSTPDPAMAAERVTDRPTNGATHSAAPASKIVADEAAREPPSDVRAEAVPPAPARTTAGRDIDVIETAVTAAHSPTEVALTSARRWLVADWDRPRDRLRRAEPALVTVGRQGASFARGFIVASSLALGAAGFLVADRSNPVSGPVAQAPAAPTGYDAGTRREMEDLIRSLREAADAATKARAALNAPPPAIRDMAVPALPSTPLTPEEVRNLQNALLQLGYPLGTVDGIFGTRTGSALAAWQSDRRIMGQRRTLRELLFLVQAEAAKRQHQPGPTAAVAAPVR